MTWKLYQGVVKPSETLERGTCHIQIEGMSQAPSEKSQPQIESSDNTMVESDEEEEQPVEEEVEQPVEEEQPPVEEKPKKKRVVKKKST